MSTYLGDFTPGKTVRLAFNTHTTAGVPATLAGSPTAAVYKDGGTTESTTGVGSITVDLDTRTGLHHLAIDTSADGAFYSAGSEFVVVLTAGTVDSQSVAGTVIGAFSLSARSALRPTTADRTLDVSATGEAGIDLANVGSPTTTLNLSGTTISTSQQVASVSGAVGSVTGAVGSVTGNVGGNVVGSVGSISGVTFPANFPDLAITATTGRVTVGTNNDKTGYSLATAPPTAAAIADAVWDETLADHLTSGSTGASLNAASSAGDPWTTTLPGSYTGSQAGKILADILTDTGTTIPDTLADIQGATFDTATDSLEAIRDRGDAAWTGSGAGLTAEDVWTYAARTLTANTNFNDPTAAAIASQVRTELATELARIDAAISTRSTYAGADTSGTTTLLTRLTSDRAGYLDALNTGVTLDLTQTGITFRDVSAVTDEATITVADCFAAAFVQTAGGESVVGTAYTRKRPAGTTFRAFTLDDATTPTERS